MKKLNRTDCITFIIALIAEVAVIISNIVKFDSYSPVIIVVASIAIVGLIITILSNIINTRRKKPSTNSVKISTDNKGYTISIDKTDNLFKNKGYIRDYYTLKDIGDNNQSLKIKSKSSWKDVNAYKTLLAVYLDNGDKIEYTDSMIKVHPGDSDTTIADFYAMYGINDKADISTLRSIHNGYIAREKINNNRITYLNILEDVGLDDYIFIQYIYYNNLTTKEELDSILKECYL